MLFLDGENIGISDIKDVAVDDKKIAIKSEALIKVSSCYEFLSNFSSDHLIYGINTGFGPMAQFKIDENKQIELQYNLIRSHATGFGPWLDKCGSKAVLVARINSLIRGESGIKPELISLMVEMCNLNIIPLIPSHGGVGASGDLVQLAHLALGIIGEGDVYYKGNVVKASQAFESEKIQPFAISLREGIALLNGTSAMTGLASLNLGYAKIALEWMIIFSSMINEIMEAFDDHFSVELNNTKKHIGQRKVAAAMRDLTEGSQLIRSRTDHWQVEQSHSFFKEKVQEYYSIRCVPQILGPVYDTLQNAILVVENELNSTSDNPITLVSEKNVFHGGNFHGDYISLEMDKLKLVSTKLSMLAERQLNYLLNHNLNLK
jgi:histidine ammonia-lyase